MTVLHQYYVFFVHIYNHSTDATFWIFFSTRKQTRKATGIGLYDRCIDMLLVKVCFPEGTITTWLCFPARNLQTTKVKARIFVAQEHGPFRTDSQPKHFRNPVTQQAVAFIFSNNYARLSLILFRFRQAECYFFFLNQTTDSIRTVCMFRKQLCAYRCFKARNQKGRMTLEIRKESRLSSEVGDIGKQWMTASRPKGSLSQHPLIAMKMGNRSCGSGSWSCFESRP